MAQLQAFQDRNPVVDRASLTVTPNWRSWLSALVVTIRAVPERIKTVSLTAQSAAISTTAIPALEIHEGLYRVSWIARISQAATTSSSLAVTITHVRSAVTCTQSGSAITGNTTATVQSGSVLLYVDADTDISYSTAYASVGATAMNYEIFLVLERIPS